MNESGVLVYKDRAIAAYGFGDGHPFGPDRHDAFHAELERSGVAARVVLRRGRVATREELLTFHTAAYLDEVASRCAAGTGFLDGGDTPARRGIDRAAAAVAGTAIDALERIVAGRFRCAFVPIGGLHHAGRAHAAGFCVVNDCGIAAEIARRRYGLRRIAYVDIDAHHGDGMFYAFEDDPDLIIADIHETGRVLYPGTGDPRETGAGEAAGTKLNIPLEPGAGDAEFYTAWEQAEAHLEAARPELIILQCGADSIGGDPITHLQLTPAAHGHAAARLCVIAERHCAGRLLALGGGGYNRRNLALAWTAVVRACVEAG